MVPVSRALIGCIAAMTAAACYESVTETREAQVLSAYAADRVRQCAVPFFDGDSTFIEIYDGADLVLRVNNRVELSIYTRLGNPLYPDDVQPDTLRVSGTYERDGFTLRFRFDEGYTRTVLMEGEIVEGGRLLLGGEDGNMEFVPVAERPTGPAEYCDV
jgi:hypothetical protein